MFLTAFVRTFPVVPWLQLRFRCKGLTPGQGTKIPHAMQQKKKTERNAFLRFSHIWWWMELIASKEGGGLDSWRAVGKERMFFTLSQPGPLLSLSFVAVWKWDDIPGVSSYNLRIIEMKIMVPVTRPSNRNTQFLTLVFEWHIWGYSWLQ